MSYLESEALCPYYKWDRGNTIKCEAGDIICRDKMMYRFIGYGYCAKRYKECPFKIALDGYYDRNPGEDGKDAKQIEFF